MAYARQTALIDAYICDTKDDLTLLPRSSIGSTCWVISEKCEYICNSKGKWLPRLNKDITTDAANYYTKAEVDNKIIISQVALTENEILAITLK